MPRYSSVCFKSCRSLPGIRSECCRQTQSVKAILSMAGYSGTPLAQKLGIKHGARVVLINGPANYGQLLGAEARTARFTDQLSKGAGFVHVFVTRRSDLEKMLRQIRGELGDGGTLWVSWPKKAAGVETDVTENVIRVAALPLGF